MNNLQIDYFMAVATNLSFTKTSEELYVSQPAISKQISLLEKELGVKLFQRNNKKTELTEAGKLYFEMFRDFKAEFAEVHREALNLSSSEERIIKIGFLEGWDMSKYLPGIIEELNKVYPDVKLVINCCGVKEISTMILTGGLDLALTMKNSVVNIPEIRVLDVCSIKKNILYSENSRYAEIEDLSPADFKDETFFVPWGIVEKLVKETTYGYMRKYRFIPKLQFVNNHESMITCVRTGMGVAITDEWDFSKNAPGMGCLEVDTYDEVSIAYMNSNKDLIVETLTKIIQTAYATDL